MAQEAVQQVKTLTVEEIQKVADYLMKGDKKEAVKGLRWNGLFSIIFGAIAVFIGTGGMADNSLNAILALIGGIMFLEGIWLIVAPSVKGVLFDGLIICVLGLWNIFISFVNMSIGYSGDGAFIIYGLFQLYIGGKEVWQYRKLSADANVPKPEDGAISYVNLLLQQARKAVENRAPYTSEVYIARNAKFSVVMLDDMAILFFADGVRVVRKDSVSIFNDGKQILSDKIKVRAKFGDVTYQGTVDQNSLQALVRWKPAA